MILRVITGMLGLAILIGVMAPAYGQLVAEFTGTQQWVDWNSTDHYGVESEELIASADMRFKSNGGTFQCRVTLEWFNSGNQSVLAPSPGEEFTVSSPMWQSTDMLCGYELPPYPYFDSSYSCTITIQKKVGENWETVDSVTLYFWFFSK